MTITFFKNIKHYIVNVSKLVTNIYVLYLACFLKSKRVRYCHIVQATTNFSSVL